MSKILHVFANFLRKTVDCLNFCWFSLNSCSNFEIYIYKSVERLLREKKSFWQGSNFDVLTGTFTTAIFIPLWSVITHERVRLGKMNIRFGISAKITPVYQVSCKNSTLTSRCSLVSVLLINSTNFIFTVFYLKLVNLLVNL